MSVPLITLTKRLSILENKLVITKLVKPRYYLRDAADKLSEVLSEKLDVWNVIDLVNEAKQSLWLDLDDFMTTGGAHKLQQATRYKISIESKEYKENPFIQDQFIYDYVQCIKFSNGLTCKRGDETVTYDKALPNYVYVEREGLKSIIAMF